MSKEKPDSPSIVTFVEDPFGIQTLDVFDAQNNSEELDLDAEISESELATEPSESIDVQMDRLAQAISDQAENTESVVPPEESPEDLLATQIAEDQALEAEQQAEQQSQIDAEAAALPEIFDLEDMQSCIEALLFISDKPLSLDKLRNHLGPNFAVKDFQDALFMLQTRYQGNHHGIELVEVSGGYQFRTKPVRADLARKLVRVQTQRLSSGSMETLAIIAYKQPVMKEEVDKIRGVDSSYFVRGLMDKKLISICGRSELPGRPILYGTTSEFLEVFGLKDLSSLPSLRELEQMIPQSQSSNPEDEDPRVKEMRRLVNDMNTDRTSALHYNPKEDEKILKEIRERVTSIPSSTPYLDEIRAAELLAQQQKLKPSEAEPLPEVPPVEKAPLEKANE